MTCCIISWAYRGQTRRGDDIETVGDKVGMGADTFLEKARILAIFRLKIYKDIKIFVNSNLKNIRIKYHYAKKILFYLVLNYINVVLRMYKLLRDYIFSFRKTDTEKADNSSGGRGREKKERAKKKRCSSCRFLRTKEKNAVCSCKQMAGNYLQFAIYTPVLALSPAVSRFRRWASTPGRYIDCRVIVSAQRPETQV